MNEANAQVGADDAQVVIDEGSAVVGVMCPAALCGQHENPSAIAGPGVKSRPHNFQRALSHFSRSASSRQTERAGQVAEEFATGGWQASNAFCFRRRLISA